MTLSHGGDFALYVQEGEATPFIWNCMFRFKLNRMGIHGLPHWLTVFRNGVELAQQNGADIAVLFDFAFLHDICRQSEGADPGHGYRAAEYAATLRGDQIKLDDNQFDQLYYAIAHHNRGATEGDITIQTCWDADRLDRGRTGITPRPDMLCTQEAKAKARSFLSFACPESIGSEQLTSRSERL